MICGYLIKRIEVRSDYRLSVEFHINIKQFLHGIDSTPQADSLETAK